MTNDLLLFQYVPPDYNAGYSSGGFMGNSLVDGQVQTGSQQQFLIRNCDAEGGSPQGNWNMVYVGTAGAPDGHCGNYDGQQPNVVVGATPTVSQFTSVRFSRSTHSSGKARRSLINQSRPYCGSRY